MSNAEHFFQSPQRIPYSEQRPLVFLEGPVQGAPDWQTPFAGRLLQAVPNILVASPRALPEHEAQLASSDRRVKEAALERQIAYELQARRLAFRYGAIVLWYAAQDPDVPYPAGRAYAKTSEKEDSEVWGWQAAHPDFPFIVGYEPGFKGRTVDDKDYGNRNHDLLLIQEHTSLDDVFEATLDAIEYAKAVGPQPIPSLTFQSIQRAWDRLDSE